LGRGHFGPGRQGGPKKKEASTAGEVSLRGQPKYPIGLEPLSRVKKKKRSALREGIGRRGRHKGKNKGDPGGSSIRCVWG